MARACQGRSCRHHQCRGKGGVRATLTARAHGPSRPPRLLQRCARLLRVGGQAASDRGRMGVRRAGRPGGEGLSMGRRSRARGRASDERLAGPLSERQHRCRRTSKVQKGGSYVTPLTVADTVSPLVRGTLPTHPPGTSAFAAQRRAFKSRPRHEPARTGSRPPRANSRRASRRSAIRAGRRSAH